MGSLDAERSSEISCGQSEEMVGPELKSWPFFQCLLILLSTCSPFCFLRNTAFFSKPFGADKETDRDSGHQCQGLETFRPKECTHRLCKSVVPENGGRRIVILAAVNNHHHWERQGLKETQGRAESPRPHALPFSPFVPITTRASSLQVSVNVTLKHRIGTAPGTRCHIYSLRNLRCFSRDISA